jgi:hypothetical protein
LLLVHRQPFSVPATVDPTVTHHVVAPVVADGAAESTDGLRIVLDQVHEFARRREPEAAAGVGLREH